MTMKCNCGSSLWVRIDESPAVCFDCGTPWAVTALMEAAR